MIGEVKNMAEISSETLSKICYEDILFRAIEDCRKARVYGDLARYSEAVMAMFDTLSPGLRGKVNPMYEEIQKNVEEEVKKTREELQTLTNPLDQAGYYQARVAAIERENADKLYKEMIKVLDEDGMLIKRREIEVWRRPKAK